MFQIGSKMNSISRVSKCCLVLSFSTPNAFRIIITRTDKAASGYLLGKYFNEPITV